MLTVADRERDPSDGSHVPGKAPMHDAGENGADRAPGGLTFRYELWGMGMLWGHTQEAQLLSYLKDSVSAFKSCTEKYRAQRSSHPCATQ